MPDETTTLHTSDGPMSAFVARPDGTPRAGIVVVQEAFGITDHIRDICRRLAAGGRLVIAPALFHRQGSPVLPYEMEAVMPFVSKLVADELTEDVGSAIEFLHQEGFADAQIGIIGFCMGGVVSMYTGATHGLGAAVTFYGGGIKEGRFGYPPLINIASQMRTPWLGLYGDKDQGIPVNQVEELRKVTDLAKVPTEIVRYADAGHGFNCDARPNNFHPQSAKDAWIRTLAWFDKFIPAQ